MSCTSIQRISRLVLLACLLLTGACSVSQPAAPAPTVQPPTVQTPQPLAHLEPLNPQREEVEALPPTLVMTATQTRTPTRTEQHDVDPDMPALTTPRVPVRETGQLSVTAVLTSDAVVVDEQRVMTSTATVVHDSTLFTLDALPVYPDAQVVAQENPVATALTRGIRQQAGTEHTESQLYTVPNAVRFEEVESFYAVTLGGWRQDPHKFQQETGSGIIEGRNWTLGLQQFAIILFSDPTGSEVFLLTVLVTHS